MRLLRRRGQGLYITLRRQLRPLITAKGRRRASSVISHLISVYIDTYQIYWSERGRTPGSLAVKKEKKGQAEECMQLSPVHPSDGSDIQRQHSTPCYDYTAETSTSIAV